MHPDDEDFDEFDLDNLIRKLKRDEQEEEKNAGLYSVKSKGLDEISDDSNSSG